MMFDITVALNAAKELDSAIGIIEKLVGTLKSQPDIAAQKLGQALGEVAKTLQTVEQAVSEYLSLGIDQGALAKNSKLLLDIAGGVLATEVQRGRGHSSLIGLIYSGHLDKWFTKVLNAREYKSVSSVFQALGNADGVLFWDLGTVAITLQAEAAAVLNLVVSGDEAAARARVLSALSVLSPLRKAMSGTMQSIYSMQSEFVDITVAV